MTALGTFHGYGKELEEQLRAKTFPIAVKLLEKEEDIPEGAVRPRRDLGYHLALCQAFSMSRRDGKLMAMVKEDNWCFEPVVGLGFAEPPQYFLEGHNRFPESALTLEVGSIWVRGFPRLAPDKYMGIVSAPLMTANFEPDLVIIYCDSAQLTLLLSAINCVHGHDLPCVLSGHAACVYAVVPVIQNRQYHVTSPCFGDSRRGMAQDNEIIFSAPIEKVEDLLAGLKYLVKYGMGMPRAMPIHPEFKLSESYAKIGRMVGLEIEQ